MKRQEEQQRDEARGIMGDVGRLKEKREFSWEDLGPEGGLLGFNSGRLNVLNPACSALSISLATG